MKRIKLFIFVLISLFVINVKADMGPPVIVNHKVMVTNKDGAVCYESSDGNKVSDKKTVIPYGTTLDVYSDIVGSYIYASDNNNEDYNCYVKYSDVSSKSQNFNMNDEEVEKINETRAIILAKGGLNMRKGPSVTYSKIVTIPQYTLVTLKYKAGTYWYYTEYNGKSGWITSMDNYIGFDSDKILISSESINIYDTKNAKVIGNIPANTEITDYILFNSRMDTEPRYYVIYNGVKGYVRRLDLSYKLDSPGKIKLMKDYDIYENDTLKKKITAGQVFEYTMVSEYGDFYVPEKNIYFSLADEDFEYVTKANVSVKSKGYLGEGLFGEAKEERKTPTIPPTSSSNETEPVIEKNEENSGISSKDIIIICLLAGIFLALTAIVIIKLLNRKKSRPVVKTVSENSLVNTNQLTNEQRNEESLNEKIDLSNEINNVEIKKENDKKE